jgi:hypothetical protein
MGPKMGWVNWPGPILAHLAASFDDDASRVFWKFPSSACGPLVSVSLQFWIELL